MASFDRAHRKRLREIGAIPAKYERSNERQFYHKKRFWFPVIAIALIVMFPIQVFIGGTILWTLLPYLLVLAFIVFCIIALIAVMFS